MVRTVFEIFVFCCFLKTQEKSCAAFLLGVQGFYGVDLFHGRILA